MFFQRQGTAGAMAEPAVSHSLLSRTAAFLKSKPGQRSRLRVLYRSAFRDSGNSRERLPVAVKEESRDRVANARARVNKKKRCC
jgi:hypothetical protein